MEDQESQQIILNEYQQQIAGIIETQPDQIYEDEYNQLADELASILLIRQSHQFKYQQIYFQLYNYFQQCINDNPIFLSESTLEFMNTAIQIEEFNEQFQYSQDFIQQIIDQLVQVQNSTLQNLFRFLITYIRHASKNQHYLHQLQQIYKLSDKIFYFQNQQQVQILLKNYYDIMLYDNQDFTNLLITYQNYIFQVDNLQIKEFLYLCYITQDIIQKNNQAYIYVLQQQRFEYLCLQYLEIGQKSLSEQEFIDFASNVCNTLSYYIQDEQSYTRVEDIIDQYEKILNKYDSNFIIEFLGYFQNYYY